VKTLNQFLNRLPDWAWILLGWWVWPFWVVVERVEGMRNHDRQN
jgi:hypothetical protein